MDAELVTALVTGVAIEGASEVGTAVVCLAVLDVDVGVGDGDIWSGQCVNVLLLFTACSLSTFSFVHTLYDSTEVRTPRTPVPGANTY